MKSLFPIVCVIASTNLLSFGLDTSLNLPSFDDIQKSINEKDAPIQNELDKPTENIVITFNDDKKVPEISSSDKVSVDFINEDIKNVLRYISELYDLNIIIPTSLSGNVTLRLKNVTWQSLLKSVLTPLGCSYRENDGIVQICSLEMAQQEPLKTKTFLLKYADAKTVADELKDFIDTDNKEKLTFNTRANLLIWTGHNNSLSDIESIIDKLDRPETQVMIEAKFVEANNTITDEHGINWPSGIPVYFDDAGSKNSSTTTTNSSNSTTTTTTSSGDIHGQVTYGLSGAKAFAGSSIFIKNLSASFNFTQTDNIGKTLSNPTIITMNNIPATISVIKNYPIPNYSYNSDQGVYEISGFEEKPIGIELKVTPKVQSEYITLQLEPSLSNQSGSVPFSAGSGTNINYPVVDQKKTSSIVTIKSGYTIAIGGLMSQNKENSVTKVPLLGNLPLLGNFFTNKSKKDILSNLLIFLSATQIDYDGTILYQNQVGAKNISDRRMFEMGITPKDLPGEAPMNDEEKALYSEIQTLRSKLDNLKLNKKANKSKISLNSCLRRENKHKKVPQTWKTRNSKLKHKGKTKK